MRLYKHSQCKESLITLGLPPFVCCICIWRSTVDPVFCILFLMANKKLLRIVLIFVSLTTEKYNDIDSRVNAFDVCDGMCEIGENCTVWQTDIRAEKVTLEALQSVRNWILIACECNRNYNVFIRLPVSKPFTSTFYLNSIALCSILHVLKRLQRFRSLVSFRSLYNRTLIFSIDTLITAYLTDTIVLIKTMLIKYEKHVSRDSALTLTESSSLMRNWNSYILNEVRLWEQRIPIRLFKVWRMLSLKYN